MAVEPLATHQTASHDLTVTGVVAIDDSGTPGTPAKSPLLHLNRKTWAAVIVPPAAVQKLHRALEVFIDGVRSDYGVTELHFPEIYNGRGAFKDVPIEKRYEIFDLMAALFQAFRLPILIQTCSPEFLREIRPRMVESLPELIWFDLDNHEHVALLFLFYTVRMFVREQRASLPHALSVVIDEGPLKAGSQLPMPGWADVFAGGGATFQRSHENPFLQLADFAAFAIARTQWITSAGIVKPRDREFLRIVSAERLWYANLPSAAVNPDETSAVEYERMLKADRLLKGLPPDLPT